jgi:hypothetical protein
VTDRQGRQLTFLHAWPRSMLAYRVMRKEALWTPAALGLASVIFFSSVGCEERPTVDGVDGVDASGAGGSPAGGAGGSLAGGAGGSPAGGAGGSSAAGAGGSSAAGAAGGPCEKDLSGTWDLIASRRGGAPRSGIMSIGANSFEIQIGEDRLSYNGLQKQAVWQSYAYAIPITAINTPAAFDSGSQPLKLGGDWSFTSVDGRQECTLSVAANLIAARCRAAISEVGGSDWPGAVARPRNGQPYSVIRGGALPSQFGDFGGMWLARPDGDPGPSCAVTVEGNKFTAICMTQTGLNGTTEVTVGADCVASGTSGQGYELSGRRR